MTLEPGMPSDRNPPSPTPVHVAGEPRWRVWSRWTGRVTAYLVVGGLNTVALLCVLFLWFAWLSGDYQTDRDMQENGGIWLTMMALAGGGSAGLSLLVAAVAARLRWMPRWTLALPGVLLAATVLAAGATSAG
jgi:hypothetical protein